MKLIGSVIAICVVLLGLVVWQVWRSVDSSRLDAAPGESPKLTSLATPTSPVVQATEPSTDDVPEADPQDVAPASVSKPVVQYPTQDPETARLERVAASARAALADDPQNAAALEDAAGALCELERWPEAAALLERLADLKPDDASVQRRYADALMRQGRWQSALAPLKVLVQASPEDDRAWHNLAVAHQALGQLTAAREAWDRVIDLRPDSHEAYARRAEVQIDFEDWPAAARDLTQALMLEPRDVDIALNLALVLTRLGRYAEAVSIVDRVLKPNPRHVPALNRLGQVRWAEHTADPSRNIDARAAAIDAWERSLAIDPEQPDVRALVEAARRDRD